MGSLMQDNIGDMYKIYLYLTSANWKHVLPVLSIILRNQIDIQLYFILDTLKIENVNHNWESPKYENKTWKQTYPGARTETS